MMLESMSIESSFAFSATEASRWFLAFFTVALDFAE